MLRLKWLALLGCFLAGSLVWAGEKAPTGPAGKFVEADYTLSFQAETSPDGKGGLALTVNPNQNRKINKDFPIKLTLSPSAGVRLPKTSMTKKDAAKLNEHELTMKVPYELSGKTAGETHADISFGFGTCEVKNGEVTTCKMHTEKRSIPLPANANKEKASISPDPATVNK